MRSHSKIPFAAFALVLLSACAANATPTDEAALSNIYTAAAPTVAAQVSLATPASTQVIVNTATPFTFPTTLPVTATNQSVIAYSVSAFTANGCDDAAYVSDVTIPDGTILAPGESFVKTWEFQNTGTCAWNRDYLLTFVSGTSMSGEAAEIDEDVATGTAGDISISLVAPTSEGTFTGYWRLADEDGNVFGQSVYIMIVVSDDAATLTPTATTETEATAEPTSTATPTAIPTFTSTPAETSSQ
jgi:hypothetical protein